MSRVPRGSVVPGLVIAALGAGMIVIVFAANFGATPMLDRLAFVLGLAWAPLAVGVGLSLLLIGLWLVWRVRTGQRE